MKIRTTRCLFVSLIAMALPLVVKAQPPASLAAALQHRYSFNGDAKDSVGHADGELKGTATISDGQVHLDGAKSCYVNLPGGLIAGDKAVTFEFWASLGTNRSWCRVFDQGTIPAVDGGHMDLYFCPHSGNRDFRLTVMDPNPTERVISVRRANLDEQTNIYVACVLDPPTGFMGIYTNGILAVSTNNLTSLTSVATNSFFLGHSLFTTDPGLNGSIEEFRIYNAPLSPAQVADNFKNGPNALLK